MFMNSIDMPRDVNLVYSDGANPVLIRLGGAVLQTYKTNSPLGHLRIVTFIERLSHLFKLKIKNFQKSEIIKFKRINEIYKNFILTFLFKW